MTGTDPTTTVPPATGLDGAAEITVSGPSGVLGTVAVPGDKSISHRALLLSGLAKGRTVVTGLSTGEDVLCTLEALRSFGVGFTWNGAELHIDGGLQHEPAGPLDHGNSGTGMRLMAGVCAGHDMFSVLTGDEFLRRRPMGRVAEPLRAMGAVIDGRAGGDLAPLAIRGGNLQGIDFVGRTASAQVKSAVLLAGLNAAGRTSVTEPTVTRRHTEEMLQEFGLPVQIDGRTVTVAPGQPISPGALQVRADPSAAAFWLVAALIAADSRLDMNHLYLGPGRNGLLTVLLRMGADLTVDQATGHVEAGSSHLVGTAVGGDEVPDLIDEVPILAVAAAHATGTTTISGAAELRVKESDRISSTVAMLTAFGARVHETDDGMVIEGGHPLHAAEVDAHGDHRIAMSAAICALTVSGPTTVHGWSSVATSYPGFARDLTSLAADATMAPAAG